VSLPNQGKKHMDGSITDQVLIKEIWPRHAAKNVARVMRVSFETARHWVETKVSERRRSELAQRLLRVMEEQDIRRGAVRRQLEVMANVGRVEGMGETWAGDTARRLARDIAPKE
jgi:hypothetical protein